VVHKSTWGTLIISAVHWINMHKCISFKFSQCARQKMIRPLSIYMFISGEHSFLHPVSFAQLVYTTFLLKGKQCEEHCIKVCMQIDGQVREIFWDKDIFTEWFLKMFNNYCPLLQMHNEKSDTDYKLWHKLDTPHLKKVSPLSEVKACGKP
jgi:hypothetical protein